MKSVNFDIVTSVSINLSKENLLEISRLTGILLEDLTPDDIADYLISQVDYSFNFMPEGEERLMESYSTEITDFENCKVMEEGV